MLHTEKERKKVLFVCIHNSARSQMAETFLNHLGGAQFQAESAGIEPGNLNQTVVQVMKEAGYDISSNKTKGVQQLLKEGRSFDFVIAVCDKEAQERCPIFPGKGVRLHWPFGDPSSFQGPEEERLAFTRKIRDQIRKAVETFIQEYA